MVHFRALPGSSIAADGVRGGYGWHLGRADSITEFYAAIELALGAEKILIVEYEQSQEITSPDELGSDEQRELFDQLDKCPIQFGITHTYRDEDS